MRKSARAMPAADGGGGDDDESLARYKASLLGPGSACSGPGGADCACASCARLRDPRKVLVIALVLCPDGRPEMVLPVANAEEIAALPSPALPLIVREGASYRTRVRLSVAHGVALGLRLRNDVSNSFGLVLERQAHALGSYPPAKPLDVDLPPAAWPEGFLARGNYHAHTVITDDDGAVHLDIRWSFAIAKRWPDET